MCVAEDGAVDGAAHSEDACRHAQRTVFAFLQRADTVNLRAEYRAVGAVLDLEQLCALFDIDKAVLAIAHAHGLSLGKLCTLLNYDALIEVADLSGVFGLWWLASQLAQNPFLELASSNFY